MIAPASGASARRRTPSRLVRVARLQARLVTPGLALDGRGVALGRSAVVLLASLERLVTLLATVGREVPIDVALPAARVAVGRTDLGARAVLVTFEAESSDAVDRVAAAARTLGGLVLTGTHRHFVQYRDAAAPHGYDLADPVAIDGERLLHHDGHVLSFDAEREVDLAEVIRAVRPSVEGVPADLGGSVWVLAEPGVGPPFADHLVRAAIRGEVGRLAAPQRSDAAASASPFLFRLPDAPRRIAALLRGTPGLRAFTSPCEGVAVEHGFRHPVPLGGCRLFPPSGLVLFRARGEPALVLASVPPLVDVRELRGADVVPLEVSWARALPAPRLGARLRLRRAPCGGVPPSAALLSDDDLPRLRRFAYAFDRAALAGTKLAVFTGGAVVLREPRLEGIPLGVPFRRLHEGVYVALGLEPIPSVSPEAMRRALGTADGQVAFLSVDPDGQIAVLGVESSAFLSLEAALLDGPAWAPVETRSLRPLLEEPASRVLLEPLGVRPLAGLGDDEPPEDP